MKRILCLIIACLTIFCMFGCSKDNDDKEKTIKYTYDVDDNFVGEYILDYFKNNKNATTEDILDDTKPLYEESDKFEISTYSDLYFYYSEFPKELRKTDGYIIYTSDDNVIANGISFTFEIDDSADLKEFYNNIIDYFEDALPNNDMSIVDSEFAYIYLDSIHWIGLSIYPDLSSVSVSLYED